MEGWVRIRIAGQTEWKKVWMSITAAADAAPSNPNDASSTQGRTKKRMSTLFSSNKDGGPPASPLPPKPVIAMFAGPRPKDRRKPILTFHNVTQAFAVYPERPDLISRSTLIKLEGLIGDEEAAGDMGRREGWLLVMPELEGGLGQAEEMLKWIVGESASYFSVSKLTFCSAPRRVSALWTTAGMDLGPARSRVPHVRIPRWA
jgi:CCR4-NOT transcriptional complex subunit CAF120